MNKEQAIKELNEIRELVEEDLKYDDYEASVILDQIDLKALIIVLNLLEKQQKEIETLKNNNKDLLRKLRNRVKEVKKLEKYSLYKKEFATLNKRIEKKDKIINEMSKYIRACDIDEDICKTDTECISDNLKCENCIIDYFTNKVDKEGR